MADLIERELDWGDEISRESDFTIIPEGDYDFTVTGFERGRHEGSEKLPPCNKAIVTLSVKLPDGSTAMLKHNLFLHTRCEGLLSAFFTGIGLKRKGEPLRMNWNAVTGAAGRCHIKVRTYTKQNGETGQSNDISKFYEPGTPAQNSQPAPVQTAPAQYQQTSGQQYAQPVQQQISGQQPASGQPTGVFTPGKW